MKTFKDNEGRSWDVTVNVDAIKRVRGLVDVDLLEAADGKLIEKLVCDPVLLCDVIYALCRPQADRQSVSDEQFGQSMAGDAIDDATAALLEELVNFFPQAKRRVLSKALGKLKELESRAIEHAEAQLDGGALEAQMEKLLRSPGNSSGHAPASSDSTPVR
jgi:hypothetical protein